jgi:CRISPR-associated protein Csc3
MDGKTWSELIEEVEAEAEAVSELDELIEDYLSEIDGALIDEGWDFTGAKTVRFGYHDQSLLNHVRNGVFFLLRLNSVTGNLGVRTLDSDALRNAIGMFVAHDIHKTRETDGPQEEFDIPRDYVAGFVERTGLLEFAPGLTVEDCWSCACAHHDSWNAKAGRTTITFTELQGYVRLADAFASSPTPEAAMNERTRDRFDDVFYGDLDLRYHQLADVKGVLTNLCNRAVAALLEEHDYRVLTIYQDGCVYAAPADVPEPTVDDQSIADVYDRFTETVRASHPSYSNPAALMDSITTARLGYYDPSDQDFFYAGPENVVAAMVRKAAQDGDTEDDPTESMSDGIAKADAEVPIKLDDTRQLVGAARLVYGLHRNVVPELDGDETDFLVTCALFEVDDDVRDALLETRERKPKLLKSGGKWEYSAALNR